MVMPIGDDNSDRIRMPLVNYALIAVNVFVFFVLQGMGENDKFTYTYACVPQEIVTGKDVITENQPMRDERGTTLIRPGLQPTPLVGLRLTLWTSMFMHGSIMHLLGNMLFLWIFGDNIEDKIGHVRYLVFYLVCGLLASLAHVAVTFALGRDMQMPSLGASGAISGVMAGYVVLSPYRRVTVIMFRVLTQVPAWVAIGLWFGMQVLLSFGKEQGVAYGAHIGGFLAGLLLIKPFAFGAVSGGQATRFRHDRWGRPT